MGAVSWFVEELEEAEVPKQLIDAAEEWVSKNHDALVDAAHYAHEAECEVTYIVGCRDEGEVLELMEVHAYYNCIYVTYAKERHDGIRHRREIWFVGEVRVQHECHECT